MKNNKAPEIRFSGFSEEWEQSKLGELCSNFRSGSIITSKEIFDGGGYPVYGGNGLRGYTETYTHEGVYVLIGRQGALCGNINTVSGKVYISEHAVVIAENEMSDIRWLEQLLINMNLNAYSESSAQPGLSVDKLKKLRVFSPSKREQTAIGNFLRALDDAIALHQRELDNLKQTKQGFLHKMFPEEGKSFPDLRFPGFTGAWKQRKLGDVTKQIKSYSLTRDVETTDNTGYRYIHYGDIHTQVAHIISAESKLPNIKPGDYTILEKGDVIVADASEDYQGIATPSVIISELPYKLVAGLHTIALRPIKLDSLFLYYTLRLPIFKKYGYKVGTGMKVFGISYPNLAKFEVTYPSIEEQIKISSYIIQIDNLINLHKRELELLKETKKTFLQKMFA